MVQVAMMVSLPATPPSIWAERIVTVGPGAQLSKLDAKDAYRIVPVHPDDWPMIGMQ